MLLMRQLFDSETSTYTYLLADTETSEAVLIDPVREHVDRESALLRELGLKLRYVFDTHVHADHVTGAGALRDRTGAESVASSVAGVACVSLEASHADRFSFGAYEVEALSTPGHTNGCMSYVVRDGDRTMAFTGDALLIRGCGRTDFQNGDATTLYRSVHEQLFSLPDDTIIYPGHDYLGHTCSSVGEEKRHNRRLRETVTEAEFVEIMAGLQLARPKAIDIALPANLACGVMPQDDLAQRIRELSRQDLGDIGRYRVIDVRQPEEFDGPLGRVEGAELIPLDLLASKARKWDRDAPLLVVCRSGNRSGMACAKLTQLGFSDVTNLRGGMLAWSDIEGGSCST